MTFTIGEFSRMTRITVKALRLYHDKELLIPDFVDPESGYRYYAADQLNEARVIQSLRELGFSLLEIKETLDSCEDDGDLVPRLRSKREELERRVGSFHRAIVEIERLMAVERSLPVGDEAVAIEEKQVPDILIAGHRMRERYSEAGRGFRTVMRAAGRVAVGKPMCLYYDDEYKESDADFEPSVQVERVVASEGVDCRTLPGGIALTILHHGRYERLGESYQRMISTVKAKGLRARSPSREIYHKGPGMILRGDPERYVTEIQFFIDM